MGSLLEPFINNIQTGVTRSFETSFMLDADHQAFVSYTIQLNVQAPLLSSQQVTVSMLVEQADPPTNEVGIAHLESGQLAGLGLVSIATGEQQQLTGWIPAGYTVMLHKTGTGSASIVGQLEVVFKDA